MTPKAHAFIGFVFSIFLYLIFPEIGLFYALLAFISSWAIDFDYYLYHLYKTGNFSFVKTYRFAKKRGEDYRDLSPKKKAKTYRSIRIFHGVEMLAILLLLGKFAWSGFYFILIGAGLHLALDWMTDLIYKVRQDKLSIIFSLLRFRRLKEL